MREIIIVIKLIVDKNVFIMLRYTNYELRINIYISLIWPSFNVCDLPLKSYLF